MALDGLGNIGQCSQPFPWCVTSKASKCIGIVFQVNATWLWRGLSELLLQQAALRSTASRRDRQQQQGTAAYDQQRQSWEWQQWQQQLHGSQAAAAAGSEAVGSSSSSGGGVMIFRRRLSVAQSLLQRKRRPAGSCLWALSQGKLLAAAFRGWRSVAWVQSSTQALQQVGCVV
jgi:hypothetical protein